MTQTTTKKLTWRKQKDGQIKAKGEVTTYWLWQDPDDNDEKIFHVSVDFTYPAFDEFFETAEPNDIFDVYGSWINEPPSFTLESAKALCQEFESRFTKDILKIQKNGEVAKARDEKLDAEVVSLEEKVEAARQKRYGELDKWGEQVEVFMDEIADIGEQLADKYKIPDPEPVPMEEPLSTLLDDIANTKATLERLLEQRAKATA